MKVPTPLPSQPLPAQPRGRQSTTLAFSLPASTTTWYSCCHPWAKQDLQKKTSENTFPALQHN